MTRSTEYIDSGATFSENRQYRYKLWRSWDDSKPVANFLMLNPSTADETVLDPTVTRCVGYAQRWGFSALVVTNLFAWRSTDPRALRLVEDPVGPDNDGAILAAAASADLVVCAWGNHGRLRGRGDYITSRLRRAGVELRRLKNNVATGMPAHPLYLRGDLEAVAF